MPRITTWVPRGPGIKWSKEQKRRLAERGRKPIPTIKLKGPIPTLKLEGSRKPKPQAVIRENRVKEKKIDR